MYRTMRAFGFGDPTQVDLPGENPGLLPALARLERDVATDDVVRPRRCDHADRSDPRVRGHRQRRSAAAPACARSHPRSRRARHLPVRPRGGAARDVASQRRRRCAASCGRSSCAAPRKAPRRCPATRRPARRAPLRLPREAGTFRARTWRRSSGYIPAEHPRFLILVKVERPRTRDLR